jgi:hypothetical protein
MRKFLLCVFFILTKIYLTAKKKKQVPAAFQDLLSFETTPTLCHAVPAYECLIHKWQELQDDEEMPAKFYDVIQAGIEKLKDYQERTDTVPAYVLAMGECVPS